MLRIALCPQIGPAVALRRNLSVSAVSLQTAHASTSRPPRISETSKATNVPLSRRQKQRRLSAQRKARGASSSPLKDGVSTDVGNPLWMAKLVAAGQKMASGAIPGAATKAIETSAGVAKKGKISQRRIGKMARGPAGFAQGGGHAPPLSQAAAAVAGSSQVRTVSSGSDVVPVSGKDTPPHVGVDESNTYQVVSQGRVSSREITLEDIDDGLNKPVATLRRNMQRIPFNPGIHFFRDPRTGVWNFDPECLHDIPTPEEFAYNRTPAYLPPGKDKDLLEMATATRSEYVGSTSTLSKAFSHLYFALSGNRGVEYGNLSNAFASERTDYTMGASLPATLILGKGDNGATFVDNDKSHDVENVLSKYGVILEKLLTAETEDFKRFLNTSPDSAVSQEERDDRGAFQYQKAAKLLMRSQLDCWDPRLPGTGVFDIKTRACLTMRHDRANQAGASLYDIHQERGFYNSFEREYYDMVRSAMLKYSMQVRIGKMDGIFVAYHNTARLFGFQYLPLSEMDLRLFGSSEMGEASFKLCVALFEALMDEMTQAFPNEEVNVTIKQSDPKAAQSVVAYVSPRNWSGPESARPIQVFSLDIKNKIDGEYVTGPVSFADDEATRQEQTWEVEYSINKSPMDEETQNRVRRKHQAALKVLKRMMFQSLPEGKNPEDMDSLDGREEGMQATKWQDPDKRIVALRMLAKASGEEYEKRKDGWRENPGFAWEPIKR